MIREQNISLSEDCVSLKTSVLKKAQTSSAGEADFIFCERIIRKSWQGYPPSRTEGHAEPPWPRKKYL
jgi:hypothetical protein